VDAVAAILGDQLGEPPLHRQGERERARMRF
jgi:hypothetical protein